MHIEVIKTVVMKYSVYKKFYNEFPSSNYNPTKKTIEVELPDYKKPTFPKTWERYGNHFTIDNVCRVYFWNTGYEENFVVEYNGSSKTFPAGLYARENVINYVNELKRK